jgi:hypothetical protein
MQKKIIKYCKIKGILTVWLCNEWIYNAIAEFIDTLEDWKTFTKNEEFRKK